MGHLIRGYRLGQNGMIDRQIFDSDRFPEGWYDSPDKIPDRPDEPIKDTSPQVPPVMTGYVYGERRRPGRPRKDGR